MITTDNTVPIPNLQIVPIDSITPHEEHDSQRSEPLIKVLRQAQVLTNPPIVAAMPDNRYVILDGANRFHCFGALGYEHLLVQVVDYNSPHVSLGVWQHIISGWDIEEFNEALHNLDNVTIKSGWDHTACAQILLQDGRTLTLSSSDNTLHARNALLRELAKLYQRKATLNRTALHDPTVIWSLYTEAIALILFPDYKPEQIIRAAQEQAYLPPGVSRHIIQGRALKLNYPLALLRDTKTSLEAKNNALQDWVRDKLAQRGVRFYAESTYQFDE